MYLVLSYFTRTGTILCRDTFYCGVAMSLCSTTLHHNTFNIILNAKVNIMHHKQVIVDDKTM